MVTMPRHEWVALLDKEVRRREAFRDKIIDGRFENAAQLREWWKTVSEILYAMQNRQGTPPDPMPMELLFVLAETAAYLATGKIPSPIADVASKGRTGPGPAETRDIRWAVTYRAAVDRGWIDDPSPSKTLQIAYGLRSTRTVQYWCDNYQPFGEERHHNTPTIIVDRMEDAAKRYSIASGRTQSAILRKSNRGERK